MRTSDLRGARCVVALMLFTLGVVVFTVAATPTPAMATVRYSITTRPNALPSGGARLRDEPSTSSTVVATRAAGTPVDLFCQAVGDFGEGADGLYGGYIWDLVKVGQNDVAPYLPIYFPEYGSFGVWVHDAFVNTPAIDGGFSNTVPRCPLSYTSPSFYSFVNITTGAATDRNHLAPSTNYRVDLYVGITGSFPVPGCINKYATKLGTENPRDHASYYASPFDGQPAGLASNRVAYLGQNSLFGCNGTFRASDIAGGPGEFGALNLDFQLRTPGNGGTYSESFRLVSDSNQWLAGPGITLSFGVDGPPPVVNSIANGGFESGTAPWKITYQPAGVTVNRSIYFDASRARSGTAFMEANTSSPGGSVGQDSAIVPQPGHYYWMRLWVRDPTGESTPFQITPTLWALGGSQESAQTTSYVGHNWTPIDVVLPVHNGGHTSLRVEFYMGTGGYRNINFDDVSVSVSTTPPGINTSDPIGSLDSASSSGPGQVHVSGWTFDPNNPTASNNVHIYVGGPAGGGGVGTDTGPANSSRPDVGAAYPYAGSAHGFDVDVTTSLTGSVPVCAYGINLVGGNNSGLGNCVTVTISSRPPNDNRTAATQLENGDGTAAIDTRGATAETGELVHAGQPASHSVWFRLNPTASTGIRLRTAADFDTVLSLYRLAGSSLISVGENDDDPEGGVGSKVEARVDAGGVYYVAVDGYQGAVGTTTLTYQVTPPNDLFASAVALDGSATTQTFSTLNAGHEPGEPVVYDGTASIWYRYTTAVAGILTVDTIGSAFDTTLASYAGSSVDSLTSLVSNDDIADGNRQSQLSMPLAAGETTVIAVDGFGTNSGTGVLHWSFEPTIILHVPGAPTITAVVAGDGSVTVTWTAPASDGGSPITGYAVSSSPVGGACTTTGTSCSVQSLTNATSYSFTVVALNAVGASQPSSPSAPVTPHPLVESSPPITISVFRTLPPIRLVDTRPTEPQGAVVVAKGRYGGAKILRVQMSGVAGVPSTGVAAVSLNVTAVDPSVAGYVSAYDCGPVPLASNVNFTAGQTVPNTVLARLASDGAVCFYSSTATDLVVDINGWIASGGRFVATSPYRLLDSRPDQPSGTAAIGKQRYGGNTEVRVQFSGVSNGELSAVLLNVTAIAPSGSGYITVYPCGTRPLSSNVNFVTGQTVANAVLAPVSPTGLICMYSSVSVDIAADVAGFFWSGSGLTSLQPARIFDTRADQPQGSVDVAKHQYGGADELRISLPGTPTGAVGVSLNLTAVNPAAAGFVTVYPCGSRPLASNLNFGAGQTVANGVISPISAAGEICIYSSVRTDLVADLNGWFVS